MLQLMGQFAKIWTFALAVAVTLAVVLIEPDAASVTWEEVAGPTYSRQQLRRMEIDGVHLGMSESDVAAALIARGYRFENPSGVEGSGSYRSADGKVDFSIGYSEGRGQPEVESFTFMRAYTVEELLDLEARRSDILSILGRPTHWTRWVKADGEIGDRFRYLDDAALLDDIDEASSCYINWRCQTMVLHRDCRPYVRRVRGAVITASFIYRGIYIEVDDYRRRSNELRRDPAFRAQDLGDAMCHVPSIH